MNKEAITTNTAPGAIGTYSQAIKIGNVVYLSGQIPLIPKTMNIISDNIEDQIHQCFKNIKAVCEASGGTMDNIVKLTIYLCDLSNFQIVNKIMEGYFAKPYPARAAVGVKELPKNAKIEIDGIMAI